MPSPSPASRIFPALGLAALFAGCSLDPNAFTYERANLLLAANEALSDAPDAAALVVRREPAFGGFAIDRIFTIDDQDIVTVPSGVETVVRVRPGQYSLGVHCPTPFGDLRNSVTVMMLPGAAYTARMFADQSNGCLIEITKRPGGV